MLSACHPPNPQRAGQPGDRAATGEAVPVRFVRLEGCCEGEPGRLADEVEKAIGRQPRLKLMPGEQAPASQGVTEDPHLQQKTRELRATLRRVKDLYLRMQMDAVRSEVGRALALVKKLSGAYLQPEEIATLHLYLAAVSQVMGHTPLLREHAEAAVRFFPELKPDADVFTPPVRSEIERARKARRTVDVSILSEPSGARVFWDGAARGETPTQLPAQAVGEHYLRLQRSGQRPWHDTIVLSSAAAQLHVRLQPVGPVPASLFYADLVLASADGQGLRLAIQPREGVARTARVAEGGSAADAERAVATLFGWNPPGGSDGQPPKKERSHWKRYWWAYALGAAGLVALTVAIPLAVDGGKETGGRPVVMPIPK